MVWTIISLRCLLTDRWGHDLMTHLMLPPGHRMPGQSLQSKRPTNCPTAQPTNTHLILPPGHRMPPLFMTHLMLPPDPPRPDRSLPSKGRTPPTLCPEQSVGTGPKCGPRLLTLWAQATLGRQTGQRDGAEGRGRRMMAS